MRTLLKTKEPTIIEMCREIGENPATFFEGHDWSGLDLRPCGDLSEVSFKGAVMDGVTCTSAQAKAIQASGPRSMIDVVIVETEPEFEREDARAAYARAEELIASAKENGATELSLDHPDCRALDRLPPKISLLDRLTSLNLGGTTVSDLSPLADLTALQTLKLSGTAVRNLSSLAALTTLQTLWLNNTAVSDLSPLAPLTALQTLRLNDTAVRDLSPVQARIDQGLLNVIR